jgi:hypothetical protein
MAPMISVSLLLFQNGLPDLPVVLIEPHRNHAGVWRIKFSYETDRPLWMSAEQASSLATDLHQMGENELADEIHEAARNAKRYGSMCLQEPFSWVSCQRDETSCASEW